MPSFFFLVFASCGFASKTGEDSCLMPEKREEPGNKAINGRFGRLCNCSHMGKGAPVIGGASGNEVMFQYPYVRYGDLKQVDQAFQLGRKAFAEVLFFQSDAALEVFKDGSYEWSANAQQLYWKKEFSETLTSRTELQW